MKVAARTISAIAKVITGDPIPKTQKSIAPYLGGPKLVEFFNQFGGDHRYGPGFPSRWSFAEDRIHEHNDTPVLAKIISEALSPVRFIDTAFDARSCADYINQYLRLDGFEAVCTSQKCIVRDLSGDVVRVANPFTEDKLSHQFITEQIEKADAKIASEDFSGAITNARSLVEAVLIELEARVAGASQPYDGDLMKLYKRIQKLLHLEPSRADISDSLRMVLSGLTSIVAGLAPMRNRMSDAHATNFRPAKRHAKLAVNVSKTLTDFLYEAYRFQTDKSGR